MVELCSLGGYEEIGKNMTAVKVGDSVFILDMGLHLDSYIQLTEEEGDDFAEVSPEKLTEVGAIANIEPIKDWMDNVEMIIPTHAHLDHVGAVPYMAPLFDAPLLCTPFTSEVLRTILRDNKQTIHNKIIVLNENSSYKINEDISVEFIHVTHSIPQTCLVAIHTPEGPILYANDFKLDPFPVLGKAPNIKRLKELGDKGVLALICDSTNAPDNLKTPSESIARELLRDVFSSIDGSGKAILISTFSSHIARLKTIVSLAKDLDRKVVFVGRSLGKYSEAAEAINLVNFSKNVIIARYPRQVKQVLAKVQKEGPENYLLVVTGHQGEPKAILSRIARGETPLRLVSGDHVIYSSQIIPTPVNEENREALDDLLRSKGIRIFNNVHVSGHGGREDIRELLQVVRPKHIIPSHGFEDMKQAVRELALGLDYKDKNIHMLNDGEKITLK